MGVRDNPRLLLLSDGGDDEMTITAIQQGDKFFLPVRIKEGDTYITTDNADGVRVKIGTFLDAWNSGASENDLAYGEIDNPEYDAVTNNTVDAEIFVWLFPVTQDRSLSLKSGEVPMQVQIKIGDTIRGSQMKCVWIDTSVITEEW